MITLQLSMFGFHELTRESLYRSYIDSFKSNFLPKDLREKGLQFLPLEKRYSLDNLFSVIQNVTVQDLVLINLLDEESLKNFKLALEKLKKETAFQSLPSEEQTRLLKKIKVILPQSSIKDGLEGLEEINVVIAKNRYKYYLCSLIEGKLQSDSLNIDITEFNKQDVLDAISELTPHQKNTLKEKKLILKFDFVPDFYTTKKEDKTSENTTLYFKGIIDDILNVFKLKKEDKKELEQFKISFCAHSTGAFCFRSVDELKKDFPNISLSLIVASSVFWDRDQFDSYRELFGRSDYENPNAFSVTITHINEEIFKAEDRFNPFYHHNSFSGFIRKNRDRIEQEMKKYNIDILDIRSENDVICSLGDARIKMAKPCCGVPLESSKISAAGKGSEDELLQLIFDHMREYVENNPNPNVELPVICQVTELNLTSPTSPQSDLTQPQVPENDNSPVPSLSPKEVVDSPVPSPEVGEYFPINERENNRVGCCVIS